MLKLTQRALYTVSLTDSEYVEEPSAAGEISGSIAGVASVSGTVTLGKRLAGLISSAAQVIGILTVARTISGSISAFADVAGQLTIGKRLQGAIIGTIGLVGSLSIGRRLRDNVDAIADIDGDLSIGRRLQGAISPRIGVDGMIMIGRRLVGSIDAIADVAGTLTVTPPASPWLFRDLFSAASGDIKDRLSTSGHSWTRVRGQFNDSSGKAVAANGSADTLYHTDPGASNRVTTGTINLGGRNYGLGFAARYVDSNNFWLVYVGASGITLYECNAGSFMARASNNHALSNTTDYELVVTCNGTSISASIDGVTIGYTSSFNLTATKAGIFSDYALSGQSISNYRIEAV